MVQVASYAYDSRANLVLETDRRGNTTRTEFDGLNRPVSRTFDLRAGGNGAGAVLGDSTIGWDWDRSSRLVGRTDGNGNETTFHYDPLDRMEKTVYADGTERSCVYDVHGNMISQVDANGTVVSSTYDLLDRVVTRTVVPAAGVGGTTAEQFGYDGASRLVLGSDDDSVVTRGYDSLGNMTFEALSIDGGTAHQSDFSYDPAGNRTGYAYPSGRSITRSFDAINHLRSIEESGSSLATYEWTGPGRLDSISRANGTATVYSYDARRRVDGVAHDRSATPFSVWSFIWDEENNKTQRVNTLQSFTYSYVYDSLDRLITSSSNNAAVKAIDYELDDVHNRESRTVGGVQGDYLLSNATPDPADFQVNQYTQVPRANGGAPDSLFYDENGNVDETHRQQGFITTKRFYEYDYRNQMVSASLLGGQEHQYQYDVFGRRVAKTVDSGGQPEKTLFLYANDEVIEERDASGSVLATYVLGAFLDEPLSMLRDGLEYWYHADDQGSVVALTDDSGIVEESYDYADFGRTLDGSTYSGLLSSAVGNPYFFTGRRRDAETGYYYYRTRYMVPRWGRFTTRDTIGIWGG